MNRVFPCRAAASLALLMLAACVSTPTPPPSPEPAPAAAAAPAPKVAAAQQPAEDADGVQCKTVAVTGSRLSKKKVCTTYAERERMAAGAKDFLDNSSRGNDAISGGQ